MKRSDPARAVNQSWRLVKVAAAGGTTPPAAREGCHAQTTANPRESMAGGPPKGVRRPRTADAFPDRGADRRAEPARPGVLPGLWPPPRPQGEFPRDVRRGPGASGTTPGELAGGDPVPGARPGECRGAGRIGRAAMGERLDRSPVGCPAAAAGRFGSGRHDVSAPRGSGSRPGQAPPLGRQAGRSRSMATQPEVEAAHVKGPDRACSQKRPTRPCAARCAPAPLKAAKDRQIGRSRRDQIGPLERLSEAASAGWRRPIGGSEASYRRIAGWPRW